MTAFQILTVDAVIVFEFNPDIRLGIYSVAVFDTPSAKSPVKFAHVELGIVCVLDMQLTNPLRKRVWVTGRVWRSVRRRAEYPIYFIMCPSKSMERDHCLPCRGTRLST